MLSFSSKYHVGHAPTNPAKFTSMLPVNLQTKWRIQRGQLCHFLQVLQINIIGLQNVARQSFYIHFKSDPKPQDCLTADPGNFRVQIQLEAGCYTCKHLVHVINEKCKGYFRFVWYRRHTDEASDSARLCVQTMLSESLQRRYNHVMIEFPYQLAVQLGFNLPETEQKTQHGKWVGVPLTVANLRGQQEAIAKIGDLKAVYPILEVTTKKYPLPPPNILIESIKENEGKIFGTRGWMMPCTEDGKIVHRVEVQTHFENATVKVEEDLLNSAQQLKVNKK